MPTCEELARWIASEEIVAVKRSVRFKARIHLLICRHCRRYAEQIRAIGAVARRSFRERTKGSNSLARLEAILLEQCSNNRKDSDETSSRPRTSVDSDETSES